MANHKRRAERRRAYHESRVKERKRERNGLSELISFVSSWAIHNNYYVLLDLL